MNILPIINAAVGIAGGIAQNRAAEARARRAQAEQERLLAIQEEDYRRRLKMAQDMTRRVNLILAARLVSMKQP